MLSIKNHKGNKEFYFIPLFILLYSQLLSQQKQTAVPLKLLFSECNDNCYKPEVKQMDWNKDTLQIIFSVENSCGLVFSAEIISSLNDTLNILTSEYANGIKGSKQSITPVKTNNMCICIFNYTLTLYKVYSHPKVILLNYRPFYMLNEMKGDHIRFSDYFKNNSERVTCENFESLLGLDYSSQKLINLYNELGNDSVIDSKEETYRTIHFPEDDVYFVFNTQNKVQSIFFDSGYHGCFMKNVDFKSKASFYVKKLGTPTKTNHYTKVVNDKNGNTKHVAYPTHYYFKKHKLFLECDSEDNITSVRFSLDSPKDDF